MLQTNFQFYKYNSMLIHPVTRGPGFIIFLTNKKPNFSQTGF